MRISRAIGVWSFALLAVLLTAGACSPIELEDYRFACTTTTDCASGYLCQGGVCVSDGGGADVSSDAAEETLSSTCAEDCGAFACDERAGVCETDCGEDDRLCAEGHHCDAGGCFANKAGAQQCDEDSDCASGTCTAGRCCAVAGQCCSTDAECSAIFLGCATDDSRTCRVAAFTLPPTGQTACYVGDAVTDCGSATGYPGQDGSVGGDKRFTELATGAILDEDSKLVWSTTSEPASTLTDAGIFCADDATADKQGRWRLPTRYELQTLVDYGADTGALIDTETFPNTLTTEYWTSTPFAGDPSNVVWVVSFQTGEVLRSATLAPDTAVFCVMTQAEFDL